MSDASEFDPFRGGGRDDFPLLRKLRAEGPVATVAGGMTYVTQHDACRAVLRDTDAFSNASGMKAPGVVIPFEDRILGELDPPEHSRVRRVMVTALTPKVVHDAEPFMRTTADALLAALPEPTPDAAVDLVARYSVPLPNRITVYLLGFPAEDADDLARMAKELMESEFPLRNRTDRGEGFANAFPEFAGYIDAQIDAREAALRAGEERTDVVSRLVQLEIDGVRLSRTASARPHAEPHHGRPDDDEPVARQPPARAAHDRRTRCGDAGRTRRCSIARSRRACASARRSCSSPAAACTRPRSRARRWASANA